MIYIEGEISDIQEILRDSYDVIINPIEPEEFEDCEEIEFDVDEDEDIDLDDDLDDDEEDYTYF